jgi:hypothetical protein
MPRRAAPPVADGPRYSQPLALLLEVDEEFEGGTNL